MIAIECEIDRELWPSCGIQHVVTQLYNMCMWKRHDEQNYSLIPKTPKLSYKLGILRGI